ncbi:phage tail assembly protein [Dickeya solani]|uniref:Phage tail assembly protein n=1 Tax=Dickeya solani TaxID=1089444 RepID=A0ABU4EH78_9GAMM|nr:phage tail assembly protein [Dickeya solani]MCZ0823713.1 phage tail assembly protein [Dickeya solani]MDV6995620.1 phage tail assembly protein [Dickeya solani]MDV7002899.1 phage tail assembly protein [Dickeya solani]MDV7036675.1 phage tail assembly protein [Dickeya solani]MDV7043428.1 phage tail assembly protein [Dickeya solani]
MKELKLSKPIMAHGERLHVLELREPTYDEVQKFGLPFSYGSDGSVKIDTGPALNYIPALASIPPSSAKQLALNDITTISLTIVGFFMASGSQEPSESDSTTPHISGE